MKKMEMNRDWLVMDNTVSPLVAMMMGESDKVKKVNLPYDAMIHEKRTEDTANKHQSGYYPGKYYYYIKKFKVPGSWLGKKLILEFDGAYMKAQVYVNGDYVGRNKNGYLSFCVDVTDYLKYDTENEIKVCVNNSMEENSRWYTGSGLYRDVNLYIGERVYIPVNGLRITTPNVSEDFAMVQIHATIKSEDITVKTLYADIELKDPVGVTYRARNKVTVFPGKQEECYFRIGVKKPHLWNIDHPELYRCQLTLTENETVVDETRDVFGIRMVTVDSTRGLQINGETVKLRGCCVHHDNGILGGASFEAAELRKCKLLKEAGFNCIRSAHQPISKAMLAACDKTGMLVMDELSDMWTRSKNINDYAWDFPDNWETDVKGMIEKDFNHPSVIMYCLGNEIQEAGTPRGAEMERKINHLVKTLDPGRFTTNSINGMLAVYDKIGKILMDITGLSQQEVLQRMTSMEDTSTEEKGSGALNGMMSILAGPIADGIAAHPLMTETIEEFSGNLDIIGLNYMTSRHALEHELYPDHVILGSETYPSEIPRLWNTVLENPHVIGDMTWTGYDYLGEAGIGIYHYDGSDNFTGHWPDRLAYVGDINLIGYRRPMSYLREIVYGLRKEPYIAVERVDRKHESHAVSPWMLPRDCIASWTWSGYEGEKAIVHVFSDAEEVELLLNGRSLGRQKAGKESDYTATFEVCYEPGELRAVAFQAGKECGSCILCTAQSDVHMEIMPDRKVLKADGKDLAYILVALQDDSGNDNLGEIREIEVSADGAAYIEAFGSADPQAEAGYDHFKWKTYDGYLLAVVRAGYDPGDVRITFRMENGETQEVILKVE